MNVSAPQTILPGQHAAPPGPVDLMNMYVMHHAFRRDLTAFRSAVGTASPADSERWPALLERWQIFASALHHHHHAEDAGLWPLLLERVAGTGDDDARAVLDAMQAEHARIDPLLDECAGGFARMAREGDEGVLASLRRSLDDAWGLLDGHLGHEERDAMAVLQQHLTEADWLRLEREHFRPAYTFREVLKVVPWAMDGLPADVRRKALGAGGPVFPLLYLMTRASFARLDAAAFGLSGRVGTPAAGGRTATLSESVQVDRPVEDVFGYLSDFTRAHEWRTEVLVSTQYPAGPMSLGTKLHEESSVLGQRVVTESEVDTFEAGSRFTFRHLAGPIPVSGAWSASPDLGGTLVRHRLDFTLRGPWRLAAPLLTRTGARTLRRSLAALRTHLESAPTTAEHPQG